MITEAMTMSAPFALEGVRSGKPSPRSPMNEAQFEAFYRKTAGSIWSYVYRLTGNASTADDLLQKTFFRFLRSNPAVANEDHRRRYVFKTATNLVFDHFRETKRDREYQFDPPPDSIRPDRGELRHDMMRVFAELKPQERALLWLAHVEESSHEEIAETLGLSTKSVKVVLFRARRHLGDLLAKKGLAPEVRR